MTSTTCSRRSTGGRGSPARRFSTARGHAYAADDAQAERCDLRWSARPDRRQQCLRPCLRVAAFAIERNVEIVVLSETDYSGFERFGFRIERISGHCAETRAACEDQIRRFWNLDLVL
jgi:hypothetical protein